MTVKKVNKTDTIAAAIMKNPKAAEILFEEGLVCAGCHMAQFESVEEGCLAHGIDTKKVLAKINKEKKKAAKKKQGKIKTLKTRKKR